MTALCKRYQNLYNINSQGMNALHIIAQNQSHWNTADNLRTLLNHGVDPTQTTYGGQTPLHIAASYRNEIAVSVLTEFQENLTPLSIACDFQGRTPLHLAAHKGDYKICVRLLKYGACPVSIDAQRQTPLHYAAKQGNVQVCRLLAPLYGRQYIEMKDVNGNTPLLLAAATNQQSCMKVLIKEFYADLGAADSQGRTIMDSVTRLMDSATVKW
eukprot:CAMPEP_0117010938 /NCGR_PEP_ID=MMETSP0472-20121206/9515_1 /TAXON_ID=693140 ORGANISM="Tiarina fusus, Strain LIS" /NCGR_SAMPLE_ID=MMETSP0472 /ASSEMBLY_ACC=CAM_ASM_000603 /LENGTH=212 /DNA_ID=CAMNT_0004713601 /DNA_START=1011 /DNA_END=1646 /DNA_ORIENTATION=+